MSAAAAAAGAVDYKRSRSHALHTVAKHGFLVQKFIFVKNLLKKNRDFFILSYKFFAFEFLRQNSTLGIKMEN